ncbi:MAG: HAD-IIIA family hydrolase [Brumimicrobium sp.]|nr:HAD-IIIA family hydrolase [Brumimicrobium sp.]
MERLAANLQTVLSAKGIELAHFLQENKISKVQDLTISTLELFCYKEGISLENLVCYNLAFDRAKMPEIKLLILDVDGVLTNGGMYYTESGDQFKRYNTKDGMGIINLPKIGIQTGIISSSFKKQAVLDRAELLKINHVYVGMEPKLEILKQWCKDLGIDLRNVAMIGDDINDLEIMRNIGFTACPADAVPVVKKQVDVVLRTKGGNGCVREMIDCYLLEKPLTR